MGWIRRNRNYLLVAAALAAGAALVAVFVVPDWFWHPLGTQACRATFKGNALAIRDCMSYNLHSGTLANVQEITLLTLVGGLWLKHNCYEHGCPFVARVKGDDGHLRCKGHHKAKYPGYATMARKKRA